MSLTFGPLAAATEFEMKVKELGLTHETCASSVQLRAWCAQNKNRYYIPESLLATALATMPAIASTGAMLAIGHEAPVGIRL